MHRLGDGPTPCLEGPPKRISGFAPLGVHRRDPASPAPFSEMLNFRPVAASYLAAQLVCASPDGRSAGVRELELR